MPNLDNSILFLEALNTNLAEWLDILNKYEKIGGLNKLVIFGNSYKLQTENKDKIEDLALSIKNNLALVKSNDFGHYQSNAIIPIGVEMEVNPDNKTIFIKNDYLR